MSSLLTYSDLELESLLQDLEADWVERKESFKGDVPSKAREAICAFANDMPGRGKAGVLFIGVKDDGQPSHCPITDELLLSLANIKTDGNILPLPTMVVEKRRLKGEDVAVVTVQPSDMPPVKFKGRIWVRTGPRRSIATLQEERILNERRRYHDLPFDISPVPSATVSDLSRIRFETEYLPQAYAPDILEANGRTYEQKLSSCRMVDNPDDPTPTVLGLLTLGVRPRDFIPGAYIQFLRIRGDTMADDVVDQRLIDGTLPEMLHTINEKFIAHNMVGVDILSAPTHLMSTPYPPAAFQQLVYNAVLHRAYEGTNAPVGVYWFDDRIEIHSPGGPYGNVGIENFGMPGIVDYRNPNVADVLKTYGFVQAFGRGIATARRELERNGNPPLEFLPSAGSVVSIMRRVR